MRVVIWALFFTTAFRYCLRALHHERAAFWAQFTRGFCFYRKLAFWIVRTAIEDTKASFALRECPFFTFRADYAGIRCAFCFLTFRSLFNELTFWIV